MTIGLLVDLLREHIQAPTQRRMIDRVHDAVASMETLLKGLLDLSRLEAGSVQPRIGTVELQRLFDAISPHAGDVAARRKLRLRLRHRGLRLFVLAGGVVQAVLVAIADEQVEGGVAAVAVAVEVIVAGGDIAPGRVGSRSRQVVTAQGEDPPAAGRGAGSGQIGRAHV